jgi:hypothetical protein
MRTIVSLHSFVDLITNSSSELFICDTKKSVATVKEIITGLAKLHNKQIELSDKDNSYGRVSIENLFTGVFREPTIAKCDFALEKFPRYAEWMEMFGHEYAYVYHSDGTGLHPVELAAKNALDDWERENPRPHYDYKVKLTKTQQRAFDEACEKWSKAERTATEKIYKQWNDMVLDIYVALYQWVAKTNNIDLTPLGKLSIHGGRYCYPYYESLVGENYKNKKNNSLAEFIDEIDSAISWNYTFKKGDIFLHSADDNSIPYDFWPAIENTFNCQRRHLE